MQKYIILGMGIQALITSLLIKSGAINATSTQQFISAIIFFVMAIVIFTFEECMKKKMVKW